MIRVFLCPNWTDPDDPDAFTGCYIISVWDIGPHVRIDINQKQHWVVVLDDAKTLSQAMSEIEADIEDMIFEIPNPDSNEPLDNDTKKYLRDSLGIPPGRVNQLLNKRDFLDRCLYRGLHPPLTWQIILDYIDQNKRVYTATNTNIMDWS